AAPRRPWPAHAVRRASARTGRQRRASRRRGSRGRWRRAKRREELSILFSEILRVLDDRPDLVFTQVALERRHLRLLAAVPDFVEEDAVGVARRARRIGQIGRRMLLIAVRTVAFPLWSVAL